MTIHPRNMVAVLVQKAKCLAPSCCALLLSTISSCLLLEQQLKSVHVPTGIVASYVLIKVGSVDEKNENDFSGPLPD
jgi:hypothetical protein